MAKKRMKVSVNAVDKYLKQMKYRAAFKKTENPKIGQPKIVIPKIKSKGLQELIDVFKLEKNQNKALNIKVPIVKLKRASVFSKVTTTSCDPYSKNDTNELNVDQLKKDIHRNRNNTIKSVAKESSKSGKKIKTTQPIKNTPYVRPKKSIISNHSKIIKNKKVKISKVNENKLKIIPACVKVNQKTKLTKALPSSCFVTLGKKSAENLPESSFGPKKAVKRKFPNPLHDAESSVENKKNRVADIGEKNDLPNVEETLTEDLENLDVARTHELSTSAATSKEVENQNEIFESEETNPPGSTSNEPCLCEPVIFDVDGSLHSLLCDY